MRSDWLPIENVTHDGATAVMRLDIATTVLEHDGALLAAYMFNAGVTGQPHQLQTHPVEVLLSALVGVQVEVSGVSIELVHDDWRYTCKCPTWLADFYRDCIDGKHPLLEGEPRTGMVHAVDVFARLAR